MAGLKKSGRVGSMEASFRIAAGLPHKPQGELVQSAERAAIHAFGWPIGIVLHNENRPKPMSEGIVAEIEGPDSSYDYWALRTNGDFFFLGSLFEDERAKDAIWLDTRVMRVTETFLFCYRLYKALGATEETGVTITLRHGGLRGRTLGSARPALWMPGRVCHEDEVSWKANLTLESLRTQLPQTVEEALDPLLVLFDFFQPQDGQVRAIVEEFLARVSGQQAPFDL
ncbi:MAG: hypothetical protein WA539_02855 [Candidatus Sulfotelmatobacter sp.]